MADITETYRRMKVDEINTVPRERESLEKIYNEVWDTKELQETFQVLRFAAPFCMVIKKSTGEKGAVMFQHMPRFYFSFVSVK